MKADDKIRNIYEQRRYLLRYITSGFKISKFAKRLTAF